jgi:hypothetical protein
MDKYRKQYYQLLKKVYVDEMNWDYSNNPSKFKIEESMLVDHAKEKEVIQTLVMGEKVVMGFRITERCLDIRLHCGDSIPYKYLDNGIEAHRVIFKKEWRGLQLSQMIGKLSFDYARKHNFRYIVMVTPVKGWIKRFKSFPGLSIFPSACKYPDETLDVFIFDANNFFLRLLYSKYIFYPSIGISILSRLMKKIKTYSPK